MARILSKIAWRCAVSSSGCYISPSAPIGGGLTLPHPVGIVIGDGVVIGEEVTIYQHVTLGRGRADEEAYPVIGNGVTIYAGAAILGPVRIGNGAVIGANAVVVTHVPPGAVFGGVPARSLSKD